MKIKIRLETVTHVHDLAHDCPEMVKDKTLSVVFKGVLQEKRLVMHIRRPGNPSQKRLMIDLLRGAIEHLQESDSEEMVH